MTKIAPNETSASSPPSAGPTLMPRLTASRFSAYARRRCSGAAKAPTSAIVAGRTVSDTTASGTSNATRLSKLRASGSRKSKSPEPASDAFATRRDPHRSPSRPRKGEHASAVRP
ncbi:MAG TPA: hypothetical protein VFS43_24150 [Polyangiaceae bacterium]|nr:hypothetical protein [Polyangiaceae bacterium]